MKKDWVLIISSEYGSSTSLFSSYEQIKEQLDNIRKDRPNLEITIAKVQQLDKEEG